MWKEEAEDMRDNSLIHHILPVVYKIPFIGTTFVQDI